MRHEVGRIGLWTRVGDWTAEENPRQVAAEAEELGYGTVWIGGVPPETLFPLVRELFAETRQLTVASGIASIWEHEAADTARAIADLDATHPERFLLGLGVSHAPAVRRLNKNYTRPYSAMVEYLDTLDASTPTVPANRRVLAALGPRMLRLAAQRAAGAHPYSTTPEHTATARQALGAGPLLAPEQKVLLESDPSVARRAAREAMAVYLALPNYTNNLLRSGFTEADLADGGSDRLVDALVAWGDEDSVRRRVHEHLQAGADHVAIQAIPGSPEQAGLPRQQWRRLAPALVG